MQSVEGGEDKASVVGRALMNLGYKMLMGIDRFIARRSKVGEKAFFDVKDFPWVADIEADWQKARAELDALLPYADHLPNYQDISREITAISQDDGWKTYFFYAYGIKAPANCRRCPETAKLLKRIPGMKTGFFSILAPGKRLPPHHGPFKGVLRLHLALLIPEPAEKCGIRVGTETRHWQEGKVMIFDETYEHEAWNETEGLRVVLFVDVLRPTRFPANLLNSALTWIIAVSPVVLGAAGSYLRWERRFEAMVNAPKASEKAKDKADA